MTLVHRLFNSLTVCDLALVQVTVKAAESPAARKVDDDFWRQERLPQGVDTGYLLQRCRWVCPERGHTSEFGSNSLIFATQIAIWGVCFISGQTHMFPASHKKDSSNLGEWHKAACHEAEREHAKRSMALGAVWRRGGVSNGMP